MSFYHNAGGFASKEDVSSCLNDIVQTLCSVSGDREKATFIANVGGEGAKEFWREELIYLESRENLLLSYDTHVKTRRLSERSLEDIEIFCRYCGDCEEHITQERCGGGVDEMVVYPCRESGSALFVCNSCRDFEEATCASCGISHELCCEEGIDHDVFTWRTVQVHEEPESDSAIAMGIHREGPCQVGFCPHCITTKTRSELLEELCWRADFSEISYISGDEDEDEDEEDIYIGEYENEDLPENNTEKVTEIKEDVKKAGEMLFDIQDKINDGEYLKIMDMLQKITNGLNGLPFR